MAARPHDADRDADLAAFPVRDADDGDFANVSMFEHLLLDLARIDVGTAGDMPVVGTAFGVEKPTNYEAGFKSSFFNRRLRFNASVFHMVYAGKQTATLQLVTVNPQGNISVIQNIGAARINGLDLEVAALLARGLNVSMRPVPLAALPV